MLQDKSLELMDLVCMLIIFGAMMVNVLGKLGKDFFRDKTFTNI